MAQHPDQAGEELRRGALVQALEGLPVLARAARQEARHLAIRSTSGFRGHLAEYTQHPAARMRPACMRAASGARPAAYLGQAEITRPPGRQEIPMTTPNRKLAVAVIAALAASASQASSHREAPNITRMPAVDATDFYMFNSYEPGRKNYVTILADYVPLQDAYGGPNYFALDEDALYEILIDNDGDAREDLTFQFRFANRLGNGDQGLALDVGGTSVAVPLKNIGPVSAQDRSLLNFTESYTLRVVRGDRRSGKSADVTRVADGAKSFRKPYDFVGTKTFGSAEAYEAYARSYIYDIKIPGCGTPGRVFVGQRDEPFAVNLGKVFDLVNLVPVDGSAVPGRHHAGPRERHDRRQEHHDHRAGTAARLPHPQGQRRDRRLDHGVGAQDPHGKCAGRRGGTGKRGRRLGAGLAPLESPGQRGRDRPAGQGQVQCERAEERRPVRGIRDEPDVAGAARRAVPRCGECDARARASRTSRRRTCRATTW